MSIRTRITGGVMLGLALCVAVLIAGRIHALHQAELRYEVLAVGAQEGLWRKIVSSQVDAIKVGVSTLTRNRNAMKALADGDQAALLDAVTGLFNRMSTQKIISRLHIANLSAANVYSSADHMAIENPMAKAALDEGGIVTGLVRDADGKVMVAVATPLFQRGKPVGAGVLMRDADAALADLKEGMGVETALLDHDGRWLAQTDPGLFDNDFLQSAAVSVDDRARETQAKIGDLVYTVTSTGTVDYTGRDLSALVTARDETTRLLERARDDLIGYCMTAFLICLIIGAIYFYIAHNFRMLTQISGVLSRLQDGEHVDVPGIDRKDEIGELAGALASFAQEGISAARIKLALDNADVSVMVADANYDIVYVNERLLEMFKAAESDIRRDLPTFRSDDLIGSNIDSFHKNTAQQRDMLAQLTGTHKAEIKVGGRDLTFVANPVLSDKGERLGTVVEWRDLTTERALQEATEQVVTAASAGDFSKRIDTEGMHGTMAGLADGINQLTLVIDESTHNLGNMLEALAKGDLTKRIEADYQGTLGELKDNANRTAEQLSRIVGQIQAATGEVHDATSEITSGTEDLSRRTEQAASSLEETAASTEEMSATVKQNAENARNASELAGSANASAKTGGDVVEQAVGAMAGIENAAEKITDIISVIDEIAFQTNLLALNASVEAARAGEAGKGFAVVAQEVRQLAQRAGQAAADIKQLIQDSNTQVKDGVQLVNRAGEALTQIVGSIGKVAGIVEEISSASQEQAIGVQEINSSIAGMDDMTQQNSALVEESTATARALGDQAKRLAELMTFFKLESDQGGGRSHSLPVIDKNSTPRPALALAGHDEGWNEF